MKMDKSPVGKNSGEGSFIVHYLGATMMDTHFQYTDQMMPWIIAEIFRFTEDLQALLIIKNYQIIANCAKTGRKLFESHVFDYLRDFAVVTDEMSSSSDGRHNFVVIFRTNDIYLHCRLLSASSELQVKEIIATMKESAREFYKSSIRQNSVAELSGSSASSSSFSDSMSFEVFYMGKLRMSTTRAPQTFIDDGIEKFRNHELERDKDKEQVNEMAGEIVYTNSLPTTNSNSSSFPSSTSTTRTVPPTICLTEEEEEVTESPSNSNKENENQKGSDGESPNSPFPISPVVVKSNFHHPLEDISFPPKSPSQSHRINNNNNGRPRHPSTGDVCLMKSMSLPVEPMRTRAFSTGSSRISEKSNSNRQSNSLTRNRTMLMIVGRNELRIISPDTKSVLFTKSFTDICQIAKGLKNKDCFGFICRESERLANFYVSLIFKCESDSVASELIKVLRQAVHATQESLKKQSVCEHCPMQFFHSLCTELDGLSDDRVLATIVKRVESLPEEDRMNILAKFNGAEPQTISEQTELYMMLLRAYCESKQRKHIHDTTENRHEFLNQYLGGGAILLKAKRSLTNSFDQLLKKKSIETKINPVEQAFSRNNNGAEMTVSDSPLTNSAGFRQRSSTIGALSSEKVRHRRTGITKAEESGNRSNSLLTPQKSPSRQQQNSESHSPMMNIFMKSANKQAPSSSSSSSVVRPKQVWRQAIFKRVVSPPQTTASSMRHSVDPMNMSPISSRHQQYGGGSGFISQSHSSSRNHGQQQLQIRIHTKRTKAEIKDLWQTAIRQQILLIRMEKQNFMLKAKQAEATTKRNKLNYAELGICDEEANDTWDLIISQAQAHSTTKCDIQVLDSALLRGIPKYKRGQVWQLFMQQSRIGREKDGNSNQLEDRQSVSYESLLHKLTSHQHAILIDLGRTFPSHQYFSGSLGSGQLALFNLLKAYSLLDPDVGYCQGLSFVAGLLLMHLDEEDAFAALKYLMFDLNGREHYKSDMLGLQIKMYQLSRLIHDQDLDIHLLLYHNDVPPTLYAAPWFLTIFSSQFPIGFAVRILDVVMLHGFEVLVPFALALILDRKQQLLECSGLESVMECFKMTVTQITSEQLDKYLKKVLEMDWEEQLLTYAVEYSVMHDDTFLAFLNQNDSSTSNVPSSSVSTKASLFKSSVPIIREDNESHMPDTGAEEQVKLLLEHIKLLETLLYEKGINVPKRPSPPQLSQKNQICDNNKSTLLLNNNESEFNSQSRKIVNRHSSQP